MIPKIDVAYSANQRTPSPIGAVDLRNHPALLVNQTFGPLSYGLIGEAGVGGWASERMGAEVGYSIGRFSLRGSPSLAVSGVVARATLTVELLSFKLESDFSTIDSGSSSENLSRKQLSLDIRLDKINSFGFGAPRGYPTLRFASWGDNTPYSRSRFAEVIGNFIELNLAPKLYVLDNLDFGVWYRVVLGKQRPYVSSISARTAQSAPKPSAISVLKFPVRVAHTNVKKPPK